MTVLWALAAAGCGSHHTAVAPAPVSPPPAAVQQLDKITVYELAETKQQVKHADVNGLVATTRAIPPKTADPAKVAMQTLISSKDSPIPHGTRLLSLSVDKSTGLATVDFSREFQNNFSGGDEREAQTLDSILATLGQFDEIQNVQFLVAGARIDSLGGTEDLTAPLPSIRPAAMEQEASPQDASVSGGSDH
jgi:spore germination protein GerM